MGAEVFSFDYDIDSVNCAKELKRKYFPDDAGWSIEQGDALDRQYMETFRNYDIVYSWGVLHHTGNMRLGFDRIAETVAGSGLLYIAIYNDQGPISKFWRTVKRVYMKTPRILRFLIIVPYVMARAVANLLRHGTPFFGRKQESRGMSQVYDIYDWLGGYPFEVATPDMVIDIFRGKGFELVKLTAQKGKGCNQYVFVKQQAE
jgi:2-polyprenyl-6-hydroxyphenyl methylase/3-demethylubiquinone-9 3-methyltransferase